MHVLSVCPFNFILIPVEGVRELQLVSWQTELILLISDGGSLTMKISILRNHNHHRGFTVGHFDELLGKMIYLKRVYLECFDLRNEQVGQLYGSIVNTTSHERHILVIPLDYQKLLQHDPPLPLFVKTDASIVPRMIKNKRAANQFPLLPTDTVRTISLLSVLRESLNATDSFTFFRRWYNRNRQRLNL